MNLNYLKLFCLVIEKGSISEAAKVSYITQPTVTNQIRQLENYFDIKLFERTLGRMEPTPAGLKLYPFAKDILEILDNSKEMLKNFSSHEGTTLKIGATLTIGEFLIPSIIGKFQSQFKDTKSSLLIGNTPDIITKLDNNDIDIALVEGIVTNENFLMKKFSEDELVVVINSNHKWRNRSEISIKEIQTEKMIWREANSGIRKIIEKILMEYNLLNKIKSHFELGSTQAIKSAVEAGLGISILPELSIQNELKLSKLKAVKISERKMIRNLYMIRKPTRFTKESIQNFTAFLNNEFE